MHAAGVLAASALGTELSGCGALAPKQHEPLHLITAGRDYTGFLALLHEQYPEVNVQLDAYYGQNRSAYMRRQLNTGILPDIYTSTYFWQPEQQKEHLIDLSQYPVTDRYTTPQMAHTDVDGATYLLPYDYTIIGIGYNKTLFEKHCWPIPASFADIEALMPQIIEAGVTPSICQMNLPGLAFQYFFNVADTVFLNTLNGRKWQKNFLAHQINASNVLQESAAQFQRWIDCGLLNMDNPVSEIDVMTRLFHQGDAAFFVGEISDFSQNEDGTGDQYALLPYLSQDGSSDTYILKISRYYGLSKELELPGNEQKLEDALHVLEVLSSIEGFRSIIGTEPTVMCSLNDFSLPSSSPYHLPLAEINRGRAAPYLYAGWEGYIVDFGNAVRSWVNGSLTGTEALNVLDETQLEIIRSGGPIVYADVTEMLDTRQTAQLVGQIFLEAAEADAALISCNETKEGVGAFSENGYGVSGSLLPGKLTDEDIVAFLPTGWYGTIKTLALPGARLKELAKTGYDLHGNGDTYPYVFLTRDGMELDDRKTYTAVFCGAASDVWDEGGYCDTGIVGLDAAKQYFLNVKAISATLLNE